MEAENSSDALSGRMEVLRPLRWAGIAKSLRSVQFRATLPVHAGMSLN